MIRIRGFRADDLEGLAILDRVCFEPGISYSRAELRFQISHPASTTFVAEIPPALAGFVVGRIEDHAAGHVITIDVAPEARRKGVGTALMSALHHEFVSRNLRMSYLEVDRGNREALDFYLRLGYRRLDTIEGYYGDGRDADRMVCFLSVPHGRAVHRPQRSTAK
jgi:[ribosomal protein S18]-alanine N-acetyltransferase